MPLKLQKSTGILLAHAVSFSHNYTLTHTNHLGWQEKPK